MLDVAGSLVLLPGSILHLDCLYPRLHGNPTWAWTSSYRQYPTGKLLSSGKRAFHIPSHLGEKWNRINGGLSGASSMVEKKMKKRKKKEKDKLACDV